MKKILVALISFCMIAFCGAPVNAANSNPKFDKGEYLYASAYLQGEMNEEEIPIPYYVFNLYSEEEESFIVEIMTITYDDPWYTWTIANQVVDEEMIDVPKKVGDEFEVEIDQLTMMEMVYVFQYDEYGEPIFIDDEQPTVQETTYTVNLQWVADFHATYAINSHFSTEWDKSLVYKERSEYVYGMVGGTIYNDSTAMEIPMAGAMGEYGLYKIKSPITEEPEEPEEPVEPEAIIIPESESIASTSQGTNNSKSPVTKIKTDSNFVDAFWEFPPESEGDEGCFVYFSIYNSNYNPDLLEVFIAADYYEGDYNFLRSEMFTGTVPVGNFAWPTGDSVSLALQCEALGFTEIYIEGEEEPIFLEDVSHLIDFTFDGSVDSTSHDIIRYRSDWERVRMNAKSTTYSGSASMILDQEDLGLSSDAFMGDWEEHTVIK